MENKRIEIVKIVESGLQKGIAVIDYDGHVMSVEFDQSSFLRRGYIPWYTLAWGVKPLSLQRWLDDKEVALPICRAIEEALKSERQLAEA